MILAIDFDLTIHDGEWPAIGAAMPNAKEVINKLAKDHYIIIWTSRDGPELIAAINWLHHQGISFHRVNDNHPANTEKYGSNSRKVFADIYIDDKNIGGLPPWSDIYQHIESRCRVPEHH